MKPSTKRVLSIAFAATFLIAALVVYGTFISPEMATLNDVRSEVASKQNLYTTQKNAVSQVQDLVAKFQNSASLQKTVSLIIPDNPNITNALNQLSVVARNNQVQIFSLSVKPTELQSETQVLVKRVGVLSVIISATGSYEGLKGFLQSVETNVRLANVQSFELSPPQGLEAQQVSQGSYTMKLNVDIYYQE